MNADLKSTGTCHYTATKEKFWGTYVFTVLRKNSPYTESISLGYRSTLSKFVLRKSCSITVLFYKVLLILIFVINDFCCEF